MQYHEIQCKPQEGAKDGSYGVKVIKGMLHAVGVQVLGLQWHVRLGNCIDIACR